jgi:hypothetical protein
VIPDKPFSGRFMSSRPKSPSNEPRRGGWPARRWVSGGLPMSLFKGWPTKAFFVAWSRSAYRGCDRRLWRRAMPSFSRRASRLATSDRLYDRELMPDGLEREHARFARYGALCDAKELPATPKRHWRSRASRGGLVSNPCRPCHPCRHRRAWPASPSSPDARQPSPPW